MVTSKFRGYDIVRVDNQWIFVDTEKTVTSTWKDRPCGHCGKKSTPDGHDACISGLPDVMNACCGHGDLGDAWAQFDDGRHIQGQEAVDFFQAGGNMNKCDLEKLKDVLVSMKCSKMSRAWRTRSNVTQEAWIQAVRKITGRRLGGESSAGCLYTACAWYAMRCGSYTFEGAAIPPTGWRVIQAMSIDLASMKPTKAMSQSE